MRMKYRRFRAWQANPFRYAINEEETMSRLNECYEMLMEEGIVSAYDDGGNIIHSDVNDDPADEPSRVRRR